MQKLSELAVLFFSMIAASSGFGFVYPHVFYWTQPGNCSPCKPELFAWSLALGVVFVVSNFMVWNLISSDFRSANNLYGDLRRLAGWALAAIALAVPAAFVLIGLALLPVIAVVVAFGYVWVVFKYRAGLWSEPN